MKIKNVIAASAIGLAMMTLGAGSAFAAPWVCPGGVDACQQYGSCYHGDCGDGYWNEDGNWYCPNGEHYYSSTTNTGVRYGHHGNGGCGRHHR